MSLNNNRADCVGIDSIYVNWCELIAFPQHGDAQIPHAPNLQACEEVPQHEGTRHGELQTFASISRQSRRKFNSSKLL